MRQSGVTVCGNTIFHWGERTYVMGILNTSPDSFSGDGVRSAEAAVKQGLRLAEEGSDLLDVGGESTRPGCQPVSLAEELDRVIPVIRKLVSEVSVPISVDTTKLEVAEEALNSGASMLNDQWGLKKGPGLAKLAARRRVPIVLMSNQRDQGSYDAMTGRDTAAYDRVTNEVIKSLHKSVETALDAGVRPDNIIVDPGIGFGKTWQQDLEVIRCLRRLEELGKPLLIGPSRKSFIKMVLDLPANERVEGTIAAVSIAIANGADMVRVHDAKSILRACRVADAIVRAKEPRAS
jgi:dihydropteroate synthase